MMDYIENEHKKHLFYAIYIIVRYESELTPKEIQAKNGAIWHFYFPVFLALLNKSWDPQILFICLFRNNISFPYISLKWLGYKNKKKYHIFYKRQKKSIWKIILMQPLFNINNAFVSEKICFLEQVIVLFF